MKFVIQRVTQATVNITSESQTVRKSESRQIGPGMLILMGIHKDDTKQDSGKWIQKILNLRIFADEQKPINRSIRDMDGEILLISQFTLYGDCKGQNRPSFLEAAKPDVAQEIYNNFVTQLKDAWPGTKTGEFAADMQVSLTNDGPVTIVLE